LGDIDQRKDEGPCTVGEKMGTPARGVSTVKTPGKVLAKVQQFTGAKGKKVRGENGGKERTTKKVSPKGGLVPIGSRKTSTRLM